MWLYDVDIGKEKLFNYLQTVETLTAPKDSYFYIVAQMYLVNF